MTCDEARNAAWLAEDGEPLPEAARRHLAECAACRQAAGDRRRILEAYRSLGESVPPDALRGRVLRAAAAAPRPPHPWRWAAAAAAAAAFLVAVVSLSRGPAAKGPVPAGAPDRDAFAFESPRAAVENRLDSLEWELSPESSWDERWGMGDLRRRIEALEKSLEASTPERNKPAPDAGSKSNSRGMGGGPDRAC
jgi:hypothetical protein